MTTACDLPIDLSTKSQHHHHHHHPHHHHHHRHQLEHEHHLQQLQLEYLSHQQLTVALANHPLNRLYAVSQQHHHHNRLFGGAGAYLTSLQSHRLDQQLEQLELQLAHPFLNHQQHQASQATNQSAPNPSKNGDSRPTENASPMVAANLSTSNKTSAITDEQRHSPTSSHLQSQLAMQLSKQQDNQQNADNNSIQNSQQLQLAQQLAIQQQLQLSEASSHLHLNQHGSQATSHHLAASFATGQHPLLGTSAVQHQHQLHSQLSGATGHPLRLAQHLNQHHLASSNPHHPHLHSHHPLAGPHRYHHQVLHELTSGSNANTGLLSTNSLGSSSGSTVCSSSSSASSESSSTSSAASTSSLSSATNELANENGNGSAANLATGDHQYASVSPPAHQQLSPQHHLNLNHHHLQLSHQHLNHLSHHNLSHHHHHLSNLNHHHHLHHHHHPVHHHVDGTVSDENPSPIDLHRSSTSSTLSTISSPSSSSASITSTSPSLNVQLNDKKRINRPLTGKHVKHGTGASAQTLVILRKVIRQRQQLNAK